jgi:hypothetical protein
MAPEVTGVCAVERGSEVRADLDLRYTSPGPPSGKETWNFSKPLARKREQRCKKANFAHIGYRTQPQPTVKVITSVVALHEAKPIALHGNA